MTVVTAYGTGNIRQNPDPSAEGRLGDPPLPSSVALGLRRSPRPQGDREPRVSTCFSVSLPSNLGLEGKRAGFASSEILALPSFTFFCCSRGFPLNPPTVSGSSLPAASRECVLILTHKTPKENTNPGLVRLAKPPLGLPAKHGSLASERVAT